MELKELGEFGLIRRIAEGIDVPAGVAGIGDDCAVLPQRDGRSTLVSTDMLMEGVHFLLEDVDPYSLGWKSAAVNLSDVAAMGGKPVGTFLAFALPPGLDSGWMDQFIAGYKDVSAECGAPLLGGDTTASEDRLCICVTVLGECAAGAEVRRSGARPGDLVCVTGPLGDSAGGLRVVRDGLARGADEAALVARHYRPRPRVAEGQALASARASAMLDISDGIGSDLRHLLDASNDRRFLDFARNDSPSTGSGTEIDSFASLGMMGAEKDDFLRRHFSDDLRKLSFSAKLGAAIKVEDVPVSEELRRCAERYGWNLEEMVIDGGEDYELLFTIAPEDEAGLEVAHAVIGEITEGNGIAWEGSSASHAGFHHF